MGPASSKSRPCYAENSPHAEDPLLVLSGSHSVRRPPQQRPRPSDSGQAQTRPGDRGGPVPLRLPDPLPLRVPRRFRPPPDQRCRLYQCELHPLPHRHCGRSQHLSDRGAAFGQRDCRQRLVRPRREYTRHQHSRQLYQTAGRHRRRGFAATAPGEHGGRRTEDGEWRKVEGNRDFPQRPRCHPARRSFRQRSLLVRPGLRQFRKQHLLFRRPARLGEGFQRRPPRREVSRGRLVEPHPAYGPQGTLRKLHA